MVSPSARRCRATCRSRARARRRPSGHGFPPAGNRVAGREREGRARRGKHVVIIGGGDTGADCLGTAHRQGAPSVTSSRSCPSPRSTAPRRPLADVSQIFRVSSAHRRRASACMPVHSGLDADARGRVQALRFTRGGSVRTALREGRGQRARAPREARAPRDGVLGPSRRARRQARRRAPRGTKSHGTRIHDERPGVFVAGDAARGQSLIVRAIAEGRSAAHEVDAWLMDKPSRLPRPVNPTDRPLLA